MFYYQRRPNLVLAPPPGAMPAEPEPDEPTIAPAQIEAALTDTMAVDLLSGSVADTTNMTAGLADTAQAVAGTAYDSVQTAEAAAQAEALLDSTQAETTATVPNTPEPEPAPADSLGQGGGDER